MLTRAALLLSLALVAGFSCASSGVTPLQPGGRRVLFVGNSLTYTHDLPKTIAAMARSLDETPLVYRTIAKPDYALEDHWYDGIASRIRADGWQLIVMQQGPSSTTPNRAFLLEWTVRLDSVADLVGARSALYMVWPALQNFGTYDGVRTSYRNAAIAVDGMFIPAGEAWRTAWAADSSLALYGGDAFHPSALGTYLAALVHFEMIYGRPATDLPDVATVDGKRLSTPAATVALLQQAAHETVVAWGIP